MNIICNNCIGARLYEVTNQQFQNPFMWNRIYLDHFIKLINNYNTINFNSINVSLETRLKHTCVKCVVDNNIEVHYVHYVYDETVKSPKKSSNNTDIIYADILTYTKNKWFTRLNRMTNSIEPPIFIYSFSTENCTNNLEEYYNRYNRLLNIHSDYKLIIVIHSSFANNYNIISHYENNKYIYVVNDDILSEKTTVLCNAIKTDITNIISNFQYYNKLNVALCVIAKMENNYIREYISYYKQIGFDNIIIYDNNDIDGECFENVINDYIESGYVIVENVRGLKNYQRYAYNNCYNKYGNNYDWVAFFDSDEFLEFEDKTQNIKSFLLKPIYLNYNVIRLNWKVYDDNDLIKIENNNYSVTRFTRPITANSLQCKSIVKTKLNISKFYGHGISDNSIPACNVLGEPCLNTNSHLTKCTWKNAWLNHYRLKTIEEFIRKNMIRKDVSEKNNYKAELNYFWASNKKTKEKEDFADTLMEKLGIH